MQRNLATIWELLADDRGDRPALVDDHDQRTWAEFERRAARLAAALAERGVAAGDNVGLCLHNANAYCEAQFALFKLRATPFNVNYRYRTAEFDALLDNADATAVIFDPSVIGELEPLAGDDGSVGRLKAVIQVGGETADWASDYEALIADHSPAPRINRSENDLWILYTGGTTGQPKGVMWPHASILGLIGSSLADNGLALPEQAEGFVGLARVIEAALGSRVQLAAAPLMHGTSGLTSLQTLSLGGTVATMTGHHFDPSELWRSVDDNGVTSISIVGDAFARPMLDELNRAAADGNPYDGSSVQQIVSSGVMWSAEVKAGLLDHLPEAVMADLLGSSEGAGIASKLSTRETEATTARFVLSDVSQVFDDDDQPVAPGSGVVGHVAVGGPLPLGYYGDPDKTARTWREIDGKRWCLAGDMATVEADGSIVLLGRGSNCINTGGEKVFPEEVEEALKLHPGVVDAIAVGLPDERWGQRVVAVVGLAPNAAVAFDESDLISFAKERMAAYKAPKQVFVVERFERKPNGKPDYAWARSVAGAKG